MSAKPNKKPVEIKTTKFDFSINGAIQKINRRLTAEALAANPHGKDIGIERHIGYFFSLKHNDPSESACIGELVTYAMKNYSCDELKEFFDNIVMMKRQSEQTHRNSYAYYAYSNYIEAYGIEPSKSALRDYIIDHRRKYKPPRGGFVQSKLSNTKRQWYFNVSIYRNRR